MSDVIACSFCFAKAKDVPMVIQSMAPGVFICSGCVSTCVQMIADNLAEKVKTLPMEAKSS